MGNWTTGFYQDDINVYYEEYCVIDKSVIKQKSTNYGKKMVNRKSITIYCLYWDSTYCYSSYVGYYI